MDSVLENPEVLLDNLNAHQAINEDSAYDYATAIILKNYFDSRTRNNEMKSYYEVYFKKRSAQLLCIKFYNHI